MTFIYKPYYLPSLVRTDSYWLSYTSCDWFWSDLIFGEE